ncbi:MAG: OadG family protein [Lachnospiraceae bacterium]|nr:OadG family protein [Lachnospiraceae bacterium]
MDEKNANQLTKEYKKHETAAVFQSLFGGIEAKYGALEGMITTYRQMESDMGGIVETGDLTSAIEGKEIVVTMPVKGNECDGEIKFTYSNDIFTKFIEGNATAFTTFSQKMEEAGSHMGDAGLNTLLGMGSVFIVLILISLIIASFGLFKKKPEVKKEEVKQVAPAAPAVEEDLTDDTELVAVIMAAIRAYEGSGAGSTDGFVVRSIKKANRRI